MPKSDKHDQAFRVLGSAMKHAMMYGEAVVRITRKKGELVASILAGEVLASELRKHEPTLPGPQQAILDTLAAIKPLGGTPEMVGIGGPEDADYGEERLEGLHYPEAEEGATPDGESAKATPDENTYVGGVRLADWRLPAEPERLAGKHVEPRPIAEVIAEGAARIMAERGRPATWDPDPADIEYAKRPLLMRLPEGMSKEQFRALPYTDDCNPDED